MYILINMTNVLKILQKFNKLFSRIRLKKYKLEYVKNIAQYKLPDGIPIINSKIIHRA